jgi:hypothetical protein
VACQLGYLYNREPVLQALKEHLVDGVALPVLVKHIASLKDVTTLQLAPSGAADADATAGAAAVGDFRSTSHAHFACPLTGAPHACPLLVLHKLTRGAAVCRRPPAQRSLPLRGAAPERGCRLGASSQDGAPFPGALPRCGMPRS